MIAEAEDTVETEDPVATEDPLDTGDPMDSLDAKLCANCGEHLVAGARFCEACGTAVSGAAAAESGASPAPGACAQCGGEIDTDGYCTSCGLRAVEPVTVEDGGQRAYATHRGKRHDRNEDAAAIATTSEGWPVLVVADGVSSSPNPHLASAAAVAAAAGHLADRPFGGVDDLVAAVAAAHDAACAVPADNDPHWPEDGTHPACTIVIAVATDTAVEVANVGDARAHLLHPADGDDDHDSWVAKQVTMDDSGAAMAMANGADAVTALAQPDGHALTAWLGADAPQVDAHVAAHPTTPHDLLLVCSDGLWNYAPTDEDLGAVVSTKLPPSHLAHPETATGNLATTCEQLVSWAVAQGGADNITVALTPVATPEPNPEEES